MAGAKIRVASGNFVTARPLGVRGGVDFRHTGLVRRVDADAIRRRLDCDAIALIPPLGYSPTGEVFNLTAQDVATNAAIALAADKLIFLTEGDGLRDADGNPVSNLEPRDVDNILDGRPDLSEDLRDSLIAAADACRSGVKRIHLVSRRIDGALLKELFTRDGAGTLLTATPFEDMRTARIEDVGGLLELIEPLERHGTLVRRSREALETEIDHFTVMERDGMIVGCAALYPYPKDRMAELACLAVHADYQGGEKPFPRFTMLAGSADARTAAWEKIAAKWTAGELKGNPVLWKKIPYQGITGVVLTGEGIFGASDCADEKQLMQRLAVFVD